MNTNIEIQRFETSINDLPSDNYPENVNLRLQTNDSKTITDIYNTYDQEDKNVNNLELIEQNIVYDQ